MRAGRIVLASMLAAAAALGASVALTSRVAERAGEESVQRALRGARRAAARSLAARTRALAAVSAASAAVPEFRERLLPRRDRADILEQAREYRDLIGAAWVLVADERGVLLARTDDPEQVGRDLSRGALVAGALSGERRSGAWRDDAGGGLFVAAATPLVAPGRGRGAPQGVLVVASALEDSLAQVIREATNADVVFFALDTLDRPSVVGSTLPRDEIAPALPDSAQLAALALDTAIVRLEGRVGGERLVGLAQPIRSAGGDVYGGFVVFRSLDAELAAYRMLERTMLVTVAVGLVLALGIAFLLLVR